MPLRLEPSSTLPGRLLLIAVLDLLLGLAAACAIVGALVFLASPSLNGDWTWFWLLLVAAPVVATGAFGAMGCLFARRWDGARRWQRVAAWTVPLLTASWLAMGLDTGVGLAGGAFLLPPALFLLGADWQVRQATHGNA